MSPSKIPFIIPFTIPSYINKKVKSGSSIYKKVESGSSFNPKKRIDNPHISYFLSISLSLSFSSSFLSSSFIPDTLRYRDFAPLNNRNVDR